jgi:hypothetical protein
MNLASNAIKFTGKGAVRIDCRIPEPDLVTSVTDTDNRGHGRALRKADSRRPASQRRRHRPASGHLQEAGGDSGWQDLDQERIGRWEYLQLSFAARQQSLRMKAATPILESARPATIKEGQPEIHTPPPAERRSWNVARLDKPCSAGEAATDLVEPPPGTSSASGHVSAACRQQELLEPSSRPARGARHWPAA